MEISVGTWARQKKSPPPPPRHAVHMLCLSETRLKLPEGGPGLCCCCCSPCGHGDALQEGLAAVQGVANWCHSAGSLFSARCSAYPSFLPPGPPLLPLLGPRRWLLPSEEKPHMRTFCCSQWSCSNDPSVTSPLGGQGTHLADIDWDEVSLLSCF